MKRLFAMAALALVCAGFLGVAACGGAKPDATPSGGGGAQMGGKIIVTGIPDSKEESDKAKYKALLDYLAKETGLEFEYKRPTDYAATTQMLISGEAHLAYLGGVTTYRAEQELGDKAVLVATRDIDVKFKTYFIANKAVVDAHKLETVSGDSPDKGGSLEQLKPFAKDLSFTFGAKGSTSGHYMPRAYLNNAGMAPEDTFKSVAFTDNHDNTLKAVAAGAVDLGALNYTNYENATAEQKANAPIVFVAGPYVDYCWVGNMNTQSAETFKKITAAFLKLSLNDPEQKKVLELNSAGSYVEAKPALWNDLRKVVDNVDKNKAKIFK